MTRGRPVQQGRAERLARLHRGRHGEWVAALLLMSKGYRILARRRRTPYGEIDIIAVRGGRLAFVEVKRRNDQASSEAALTDAQARRIGEAADYWLQKNPFYQQHTIGLDAVLVSPRQWPRHLPDALAPM